MMTRQDFCRLGGAFALAGRGLAAFADAKADTRAARTALPNYWCTWSEQGRLAAAAGERREASAFAGDQGAHQTRDMLNERILFEKPGWVSEMCAPFRKDLFLVLDDGWDVPYDSGPRTPERFGFLEPWPTRFASCGATALERLTTICSRIRDAGWQGTGVWVATQRAGDTAGALAPLRPGVADYFRRKLELSARAGVRYWKVDWGLRSGNDFRRMVSELAREICPDLIVEHCPIDMRPLNGQEANPDGEALLGSGRCEASLDDADLVERLRFTNVLRTYDVATPFDTITTLDRAVAFSRIIDAHGLDTRLNVEDDPVIAAVLGHAFGIMRAIRKGTADELTYRRVANWHRLAPPFGGREGLATRASEAAIFASHFFREEEHWYRPTWNRVVRQGAPAVVARGTGLPAVKPTGADRPYVLAGRNPSGAMAVGTLPCVRADGTSWTPPAEVTLAEAPASGAPLAVFGSPAAVHVPFRGRPARVTVADLADGVAREIPAAYSDGFLHLDAAALRAACAAHPQGTPGAVFRIYS